MMIAQASWTPGEKISGEFVVACGDGMKVWVCVEEALDEIALAVEREITRRAVLWLAFDHRGDDFWLRERVAHGWAS